MAAPVIIVDYDPRWPLRFEELRAPVAAALSDILVTIEHVGSTAVPDLPAKPIIDMDVVVRSAADVAQAIVRLAALGYVHRGDLGITGREAFTPPPGKPPHHLYVCPADNAELRRHCSFRDFLRMHPAEAAAYGNLKRTAAVRFREDRIAYNEAKSAFVQEILRRALSGEE